MEIGRKACFYVSQSAWRIYSTAWQHDFIEAGIKLLNKQMMVLRWV